MTERMKVKPRTITVRELFNGYKNDLNEGAVGFGGLLNIRPEYQREFVYNPEQQAAVIDTVLKGYPLNVMYWAVKGDGFEMIDGQQRTLSICQYVAKKFSYQKRHFGVLQKDEQERILNYELTVYHCTGTASEKLAWFKTINIAGEKLNDQELRNAVYAGPWVTAARKRFSKRGCRAYAIGSPYLKGSAIRQDYLHAAIDWLSDGKIDEYMNARCEEANADALWEYFEAVIRWVQAVFPKYRKQMQGLPWGEFYNTHKDNLGAANAEAFETEIAALLKNRAVIKKTGVYGYVLTRDEKHLKIRAFSDNDKIEAYERQRGICPKCDADKKYEMNEMEADHIIPWVKGGETVPENCEMLCRKHNREKSGK